MAQHVGEVLVSRDEQGRHRRQLFDRRLAAGRAVRTGRWKSVRVVVSIEISRAIGVATGPSRLAQCDMRPVLGHQAGSNVAQLLRNESWATPSSPMLLLSDGSPCSTPYLSPSLNLRSSSTAKCIPP